MPDHRAFDQLLDDEWTQQRQEAHGRANCRALVRNRTSMKQNFEIVRPQSFSRLTILLR